MNWNWLRRPNWLRELEALAWVGFVGLVGFVLAYLGMIGYHLITGNPMPIPPTVEVPVAAVGEVRIDPGSLSSGHVAANTDITVVLEQPTWQQHLWFALSWLPGVILLATIMFLLARQLRRARRQTPFSSEVVRTLRVIGWLAIAGGIAAVNFGILATAILSTTVMAAGLMTTLTLPLGWLLAGFAALAVADILAHGVRMREDLAGVI